MKAAIFLTALLLSFFIALGAGGEWLNPLATSGELEKTILWELRWPRVFTAFLVGGLLALAGAWFQVLLSNALAEPYILGVSGSAATGAILALMFPVSVLSMPIGAFCGAWLGIALVLLFSHLGPNRLLLAGVVMAAFWGAFVSLLLALLPIRKVGTALTWMMGDLSSQSVNPALLASVWALALIAGYLLSHAQDALLLGERHAMALGIQVSRLRWQLLILASTVTAVAVTAAGTIGFIGLVIPHAMRLLFGPRHRQLLPTSALAGGILLMLADTAARTIIAPAELPVGVLTAIIGVPIFLWLLLKRS
jgi:iron complex transport system permease protein